MVNCLPLNSRTVFIHTFKSRFACSSLDWLTAYRTLIRKMKNLFTTDAQLFKNSLDIRNNIASPTNNDSVPYPDVQTSDFVFIMQSGARNSRTTNPNRFQNCNRSHCSGPANTDDYIFNLGCGFLWRKFVSDSGSRRFADHTQFPKHLIAVHLNNDAINFIIQTFSMFFPIVPELLNFFKTSAEFIVRIGF